MQSITCLLQTSYVSAVNHVDDRLRICLVVGLPISPAAISVDSTNACGPGAHADGTNRILSWPPMSQTLNCNNKRLTPVWRVSCVRNGACEYLRASVCSTVRFLKVTVSILSPIVGTVLTTFPSRSISTRFHASGMLQLTETLFAKRALKMVVFPALSRPSIRTRTSVLNPSTCTNSSANIQ